MALNIQVTAFIKTSNNQIPFRHYLPIIFVNTFKSDIICLRP